jgi:hypothetical protein
LNYYDLQEIHDEEEEEFGWELQAQESHGWLLDISVLL